jgi:hypothetical protein
MTPNDLRADYQQIYGDMCVALARRTFAQSVPQSIGASR